jgi:5-methylcytosine-specific restriction endonuclease McrA
MVSTTAWRKVRAYVLKRDGGRCQVKLEGCKTIADCVHHLRGRALGDDPRYLVASCTPCNLQVGDPRVKDPDIKPRTVW